MTRADTSSIEAAFPAARRLLHRIGGQDLGSRPVYLLPASLDPRLARSDCLAWTSPLLDLQLQDLLRARGWWRGRGFAAVIDAEQLAGPERVAAVALHEFAHYLDGPAQTPDGSAEEARYVSTLRAHGGLALLRDNQPAPSEPWAGHGPQWIRAALHLAHRAMVPRFDDLCIAGPTYGLSSLGRYAAALGREFFQHRSSSVRELLETPAPPAFLQLFHADVQRYRQSRFARNTT